MIDTSLFGWIAPTMTKNYETDTVSIVEPADLTGRVVVSVAARPCGRTHDHGFICGLVEGHYGAHWQCSAELVTEAGPFALVRVLP